MYCRLRDGAVSHAALAANSGCKSALREMHSQWEEGQGTAKPSSCPSSFYTGTGWDKQRERAEELKCPI